MRCARNDSIYSTWHWPPLSQLFLCLFLNPHTDLQGKASVTEVNEHLILSFVLSGKLTYKVIADTCSYTWEENNRIICYRVYCILVILQRLYETITEKFGLIPPFYLKFFKYVSINRFLRTNNKWVLLPPKTH